MTSCEDIGVGSSIDLKAHQRMLWMERTYERTRSEMWEQWESRGRSKAYVGHENSLKTLRISGRRWCIHPEHIRMFISHLILFCADLEA
ncbi:hypothetical protein Scep_004189 [Stephania cephalantha]|uniref:Uncharacterized protein n=1 Tax=Stephania cephalantha TaxID=152367 RepID=A0AAP0PWF8_9MAGN